jgi:nucleolar protein 9
LNNLKADVENSNQQPRTTSIDMPKEFQKRGRGGRQNKKKERDEPLIADAVVVGSVGDAFTSNADFISLDDGPANTAGPSSGGGGRSAASTSTYATPDGQAGGEFVPGPTRVQIEIDLAAPFGFVDPDVKAYFRSVDEKLLEFASLGLVRSSTTDLNDDPEDVGSELEDRTNFLHSALNEVRGLELQLATDGDTALVLERLIHSMGDWGRRVLMDSFSGKWRSLIEHRFGSHVCQTLIGLAGETIDREAKGSFPRQHHEQVEVASNNNKESGDGQLRTATQLLRDLVHELVPSIPQLLTSPFASPPIRLLLIVLSPGKVIPSSTGADVQEASSTNHHNHHDNHAASKVRSKKSQRFRAGQAEGGKMKSIVDQGDSTSPSARPTAGERIVPEELRETRRMIRTDLESRLSGAEWRAMGVENAGGPVIQVSPSVGPRIMVYSIYDRLD